MGLPLLQIACDHNDLPSALADIEKVGDIVDVIEAGTILLLQEGADVIKCFRALYPDKKLVADTKCADAGSVVARNCAQAGADYMTVICSATLPTMLAAAKELNEIQIELYGDWSFEQAEKWLANGIKQVIYHQSRDAIFAGQSWGETDLSKVSKLINMGFQVSVTGGLTLDSLKLFANLEVYSFITGRAISGSDNPIKAAKDFQAEIRRIWG